MASKSYTKPSDCFIKVFKIIKIVASDTKEKFPETFEASISLTNWFGIDMPTLFQLRS